MDQRFDPDKCHRHSIRMGGYDYQQSGAYFITVCAFGREALFGEVTAMVMKLSEYGLIVDRAWNDLPKFYPQFSLDAFVIMPNHIHGVVVLSEADTQHRAGHRPAPTGTLQQARSQRGLPEIIRSFKTFSANQINAKREMRGSPVWQRNYYEHVIRGDNQLAAIRQYIAENPAKWAEDRENPAAM